MKNIRYKIAMGESIENEPIFFDKEICCGDDVLASNEEIAKREAYNGKYTVEEVDDPETPDTPTLEDRVGTLETDTADLAEALEMILNGVVE